MKRPTLVALSCLILASLSGCIYLRLLSLKDQLSDFEKYIVVDSSDGLKITFLKPVLLRSDLNMLGLNALNKEITPEGSIWHLVFEKRYPAGAQEEEGDFDIPLTLYLDTEGKLKQIHIPDRYFAFLSKEQFISIFKSIGKSQIDLKKRQALASHEPDYKNFPQPTKQQGMAVLGIPYNSSEDNVLEYSYRLRTKRYTLPNGDKREVLSIYKAAFHFNTEDKLVALIGSYPLFGDLNVSFE